MFCVILILQSISPKLYAHNCNTAIGCVSPCRQKQLVCPVISGVLALWPSGFLSYQKRQDIWQTLEPLSSSLSHPTPLHLPNARSEKLTNGWRPHKEFVIKAAALQSRACPSNHLSYLKRKCYLNSSSNLWRMFIIHNPFSHTDSCTLFQHWATAVWWLWFHQWQHIKAKVCETSLQTCQRKKLLKDWTNYRKDQVCWRL